MINDLILLSKFDSSQAELNMAPLPLDLLIKELCSLFQVLAEQKKISLQIGNLPEIMVMGDKVRLQQLFTNLIDNAIQYTSEGSIRISVEKNEGNAVVQVVDTGIGIPQGERENIFKRFYRVDQSRSKESGGVGLGFIFIQRHLSWWGSSGMISSLRPWIILDRSGFPFRSMDSWG